VLRGVLAWWNRLPILDVAMFAGGWHAALIWIKIGAYAGEGPARARL